MQHPTSIQHGSLKTQQSLPKCWENLPLSLPTINVFVHSTTGQEGRPFMHELCRYNQIKGAGGAFRHLLDMAHPHILSYTIKQSATNSSSQKYQATISLPSLQFYNKLNYYHFALCIFMKAKFLSHTVSCIWYTSPFLSLRS